MQQFVSEITADTGGEIHTGSGLCTASAFHDGSEEVTLRVSNPAAENGAQEEHEEAEALSWLNSARITLDPEHDEVHLTASIGDPQGGFCFTLRRRPDSGAILIHTPHPGESLPHCDLAQLHPGTYEVLHGSNHVEPGPLHLTLESTLEELKRLAPTFEVLHGFAKTHGAALVKGHLEEAAGLDVSGLVDSVQAALELAKRYEASTVPMTPMGSKL